MENRLIKVLIVEDSLVAQELLIHILASDPQIRIVGVARDGLEAIEAVKLLKPDIITMDINLPKVDGFEATRQIMSTNPTPIVVVSGSLVTGEISLVFKAIEYGALAVLQRPPGIEHPEYQEAARELLQTVKLMSEIKVVRRINFLQNSLQPDAYSSEGLKKPLDIKLVAMGASTGGPSALQKILIGLPKGFSVPVLIVQHIASGFLDGFVKWLSDCCSLPIHIAVHEQVALPGNIYFAPDGLNLGIDKDLRMILSETPLENGVRPSISYLFRSVAEILGANAVGILLTGMGRDGAQELKTMRDRGAITIAQDEKSSIVFGMPCEAIKLNAAIYVLSPAEISATLLRLRQ